MTPRLRYITIYNELQVMRACVRVRVCVFVQLTLLKRLAALVHDALNAAVATIKGSSSSSSSSSMSSDAWQTCLGAGMQPVQVRNTWHVTFIYRALVMGWV
jgi:hypothetical protein